MKYKHKAVVLGTNYYIGLAVVRNLGRNGVQVTTVDYEPSHYGVSKYVNERLIAPHYKNEEKELVKFLIDYSKNKLLNRFYFQLPTYMLSLWKITLMYLKNTIYGQMTKRVYLQS